MTPPPLCYLYARYSSDRQNPLGCDDQLARGRAHAKAKRWRVAGEYRDEAVSGTVGAKGRDGWARMLADIAAGGLGKGGRVVVWSVSRWSRDYGDGTEAAIQLDRLGVMLADCSGREYDLSTAEGRISFAVDQHAAAAFVVELRRQIVRGIEESRARGGWTGPAPYGYRIVRNESPPFARLAILLAEARVVRQIYRWADAQVTAQDIARRLNVAGTPTKRRATWMQGTVRRMLYTRLYDGRRHTGLAPLDVPRIVAPDLWARVAARYGPSSGHRDCARAYALSGLVECGRCGRRAWVRWGGGGYRSYACPGVIHGTCVGVPWVRVADLEARVLAWWRALAEDPDRMRARARLLLAEARAAAATTGRRGKPAAAELADLDLQESRLLDVAARSTRTDQLARRLAAIESRRRELRATLAAPAGRVRPLTLANVESELAAEVAAVRDARQLRPLLSRIVLRPDGTILVELPNFLPAAI